MDINGKKISKQERPNSPPCQNVTKALSLVSYESQTFQSLTVSEL